MISLIPSYSLEDFSLYRKSSEVDEIFSAWSALYHPALVAHFDEAPRWEAAGSPSTGKTRKLIVIPPCAEYLVSRTWIKSAEAEGAIVIRHIADRDEILKIAFEKIGISPSPSQEEESLTSQELSQTYDDGAESFLAAGLGVLLEELITRKLRYMSNLDQVSFNTRIVDAAKAHMSGNVQEREKNLQKAFDLLTTSKEYFFPTATKFLDLTWAQSDDLAEALPAALKTLRQRNEKMNLVFPAPLIKKCEREFFKTLALLKEEITEKRVTLLGGDLWEAPLYLMSPMELARELLAGRNEYLRVFGIAPTVFARQEAGYAQIMPQLLALTGYKGALARTGDGWTLFEKSGDRSQFRWTGRDGSSVAAFCKRPLDASNSEDILQMPERIGNSYYSDEASAIVFEHRPNAESRWLHDIFRMDRYSPVLGKFYDFNEYFNVTKGSGKQEKFVKDQFKTNFLTRSVKRNRKDVVSLWVKRQRLSQIPGMLACLETVVRTLTLKSKTSDANKISFEKYFTLTNELSEKTRKALADLDASLFPAEASDSQKTFDLDAVFSNLEEKKKALLNAAAQLLTQTLDSSDRLGSFDGQLGYLFVNAGASPQDIVWETRPLNGEEPTSNTLEQAFEQSGNARTRVFSNELSKVVQYVTTIQPAGLFWIPKLNEYEYRFQERPLFNAGQLPDELLAARENIRNNSSQNSWGADAKDSHKPSIFQKLVSKLRVDTPNIANPNFSAGANERSVKTLAEYVVKRYSAEEIEKYYRLHNDYFEIRIDPTSGTVRRLTIFGGSAKFHNGVLRQPALGNRLAFDFAMKLPPDLLKTDGRSKDDSSYGYTISAADSIEILSTGPGIGQIKTSGRLMVPNGEIAGRFTQILTARLKSQILEVDVEFDPQLPTGPAPWESYYGCRFAWKDMLAEIRGGVGASLIGTNREYLQAPECVDIRSDQNTGVTILSSGIPYFRKIADARLDAILIPIGETKRNFHFAIGIDLDDPHSTALEYSAPAPLRLDSVVCPKRVGATFFSSSDKNVLIQEIAPILDEGRSQGQATLIGAKLTLLETHSVETETTVHTFLPIDRIEVLDLTGAVQKETIELTNANSMVVKFKPRQLRTLNVFFRSSSLK